MAEFRVLHCADLHLDSPFIGIGQMDAEAAERLRQATFASFRRAINVAIERDVHLVTVGGDVYDGADHGLHSAMRFRDELQRLSEAGIACCIVAGNHDPLGKRNLTASLPAGCELFTSQVGSMPIEVDGQKVATVHGASFPTRNVSENLAAKLVDGLEGGPGLHIALLHCNVGSDAHHDDYAPCSLEELKGSSFDAWLLGHVHERKVLCEAHPLVLYPGNIQGRSIREVGERGVTLICFDGDAAPTTEFIATSEVVWFEGETSIEGLDQVEDLIERIDGDFESLQESFPQAQSLVVRWHLTGRGDLHQVLAATGEDVIEALRSRARERQVPIWVEKLKFATQPALDLAELRQQAGFVSMVIECAEGEAAGDNEDNDSLTREELLERFAPLWSVSGIGGSLDKLKARIEDDPTAIRDLIDRAMLTAVSALTEGGE